MNYYIVCDAGGTKGEFLLFNSHGMILAKSKSSAANAIFTGEQQAVYVVKEGILSCLKQADLALKDITEIALFIPGFKPCLHILKQELQFNKIELQGDEENAFYGALGKGQGIVVLSGTGSFALGKDYKGNRAVSGGWGPLIGDFGSGYHIGILCLTRLTQLYDMQLKGGLLEELVLEKLDIKTTAELRHIVYKQDFTRSAIAALCTIVAKAAEENDRTAQKILQEASQELVNLAAMAAGRIDSCGLEVSLIGGVSKMGELIIKPFQDCLRNMLPQCSFSPSKYSPCIGGVLYVLENKEGCDIQSPQIINNILKGVNLPC